MAYTYYYKNLEEILQKIRDNIHETIPNASTATGNFITNTFINPTGDMIASLYADMQILHNNQSIIFAINDDLDLLAANYFVTRKQATKSTGKVRFYIANSNKPVSSITDTDIPAVINIPTGTQVSTVGTYFKSSVSVETTELIYITRDIAKSLPIDGDTGYRYVECSAVSTSTGASQNISANELVKIDTNITGIVSVTNPFAFDGGSDREDDTSLSYRIQLAITGNNIGTKDGYLRYVLDKSNVIAAKVVGAGDDIMFRDGGYLDAAGNYHWGEGGCVDIYVRGHQILDSSYYFAINSSYLETASNIILPDQPVVNIISIKSTVSNINFIDAANYDSEVYSQTDENNAITINTVYCIDIPWDFSLTDSFPDTEYYALPIGYTTAQIEQLKLRVDNELLDAREYMTNMSYSIDWSVSSTRTVEAGSTELFNKIYINDAVYKLRAKEDSNLDGRIFIMKNDQIYVRAYVQPDFVLEKDISDYAGGMTSRDSIRWLNTSKLLTNDLLLITYNYDYLINSLQIGIEDQKCLTADVLVKQAVEIPLEIIADINIYNTATPANVKSIISSNLTNYIYTYKMGGQIDRSDIASVIKDCQYVDRVDLNTLKLSRKGNESQDIITIKDNEYFTLANLVLNVTVEDNITV